MTPIRRVWPAYADRLGPPEQSSCGGLPVAARGPTDALLPVAATSVDRGDAFVRPGAFRTPPAFRCVVGRDSGFATSNVSTAALASAARRVNGRGSTRPPASDECLRGTSC